MKEFIFKNPFIENEEILSKKEDNVDDGGTINPSKQGLNGDCWLLSGINALSYSKTGQNLIKQAIKKNNDGSYDIYLKGIERNYHISEEKIKQLENNPFYSKGDIKILLFEIAIEELRNDLYKNKTDENINIPDYAKYTNRDFFCVKRTSGGFAAQVFYLLSKKPVFFAETADQINLYIGLFKKYCGESAMAIAFYEENDPETFPIKDKNNNKVKIYTNHEYAVKDINYDNITIVNPHDSSIEMTISVFLVLFLKGYITYCYLGEDFPKI